MRLVLMLLSLTTGTALAAQGPAVGSRSLQLSGRFLDTTIGIWKMHEEPAFDRRPALTELARSDPRAAALDFSLSFNCAVRNSGALADCRPLYADPESVNPAALVRSLAPLIRLNRVGAALARDKAYRLTIDVALDTIGRDGLPRECRPPFCMIEGAAPPPPPAPPHDPVLASALIRGRTCFDAAWQRSATLSLAAEKALRDRTGREATEEERKQALDYVGSRHAIAACIADLRDTARLLPLDKEDRKTVEQTLHGMKTGYDGQTRYELAILIGLLDPEAARTESSIP